jgi:uncharacterized protein (TIGR03790 family)
MAISKPQVIHRRHRKYPVPFIFTGASEARTRGDNARMQMMRNLSFKYVHLSIVFFLTVLFLFPLTGEALEPYEILVVANKNAAHSVGLAKYYLKQRNVPRANLVELSITDKEWCSREDYEEKVIPQIRTYLKEKDPGKLIRCLVTVFGVPLKIRPPERTPQEKKQLKDLRTRRKKMKDQINKLDESQKELIQNLRNEINTIEKHISELGAHNQRASFDSELALVLRDDYPLSGWVLNPLFIGFKKKNLSKINILLVSRLDGPNEKIVKRIIDDSIETEKIGLEGSAYFDARWKRSADDKNKKTEAGYKFYDRSIHSAAELVVKSERMPAIVNDKPDLFKPGDCPEAALYCGWYSLARYVPAFTWQKGAVGYHIASAECSTLKQKNSEVWCKRMLEEGVAATLGPTSEPYVQAFPVPQIFFGLLLDGRLSLAECYALSKPFWSWQMVLIGDPLYRPFGAPGS